MQEIGVVLLEMILSLTQIGKPGMPMQALQITNSLVKDTEKEEEIKEWKWKHLKMKDPQNELGKKYWHNLYTRHHDILTTKKMFTLSRREPSGAQRETFTKCTRRIMAIGPVTKQVT